MKSISYGMVTAVLVCSAATAAEFFKFEKEDRAEPTMVVEQC